MMCRQPISETRVHVRGPSGPTVHHGGAVPTLIHTDYFTVEWTGPGSQHMHG